MPVGFRRELAGVRHAQLQLARDKAHLEDMELNTTHLLTTAIRNLDSNYVLAQTHFNRWNAAQKEVDSVTRLWKGGKGTVDLVLDAQERRAEAERDYYTALIGYNKAIAEVHFRKGSLLEYNNVQLAEGPWPEKAYWDALERARERDASYYLDYGWTRPAVVSRGPVPDRRRRRRGDRRPAAGRHSDASSDAGRIAGSTRRRRTGAGPNELPEARPGNQPAAGTRLECPALAYRSQRALRRPPRTVPPSHVRLDLAGTRQFATRAGPQSGVIQTGFTAEVSDNPK